MGASQSVLDRSGQIRLYDYPYGYQKITQFPFKFYYQNSMFLRGIVFSAFLTMPLCLMIQRKVTTKENKELWKQIRLARRHTFFDPPQPVEYPKQPPHWF